MDEIYYIKKLIHLSKKYISNDERYINNNEKNFKYNIKELIKHNKQNNINIDLTNIYDIINKKKPSSTQNISPEQINKLNNIYSKLLNINNKLISNTKSIKEINDLIK